MTAISLGCDPARGAIFDETKNRILDFCFDDLDEAEAFLAVAERSGVSLYASMPHNDICALVRLWRESRKRG
ncbi:MAG: hypothetical protein KF847_18315 [Pirellulales bacterium]|nr:hypothetical protein [Pirellulales bacterium]